MSEFSLDGSIPGTWGAPSSGTSPVPGSEAQTGEAPVGNVVLFSDVFDSVRPVGDVALAHSAPGISSENRFGVKCVDLGYIGIVFCGGVIGKRGFMCVREECEIPSHKTKVQFPNLKGDVIFICGQASGTEVTTVYSDPVVPLAVFPGTTWQDTWASAVRGLPAWQSVFASLVSQHSDPVTTLDSAAMKDLHERSDKIVRFAVTPKRRNRERSASDGSPGDLAFELLPVIDDLGPTPALMLELLGPAWKTMTSNVEVLSRVAKSSRTSAQEQGTKVSSELDKVDIKLAQLKVLLGERPSSMGTQSVYEALSDVFLEIDDNKLMSDAALGDAVAQLKSSIRQEVAQGLGSLVTEQIQAQVFSPKSSFFKNFVMPTAALVKLCSPSAEQPGASWEARFKTLEINVKHLQSSKPVGNLAPKTEPNSSTSAFDFGGLWQAEPEHKPTPPLRHPDVNSVSERFSRTEHEVAKLRRDLELQRTAAPLDPPAVADPRVDALIKELIEVRSLIRSTSVSVDGYIFESPESVKAWMTMHGVEGVVNLFVDPISLLSMSDNVAPDEETAAKNRLASSKVLDSSPEMTKYKASFQLEVPPILGKKVDAATVSSDRVLAAVPTYKDWDSGTGRDGVHDRMKTRLNDGYLILKNQIEANLTGEAKLLALAMRSLSFMAWQELGTFMTTYYTEVKTRSQATEAECWILVTHCIRKVLSETRKARLYGVRGLPHEMMWGALKAHAFFEDLLANKIHGHPKISVIVQSHQVDHATPLSLFFDLKAKVEAISKESREAKKSADAALSFAKKGKGGRGSPDDN